MLQETKVSNPSNTFLLWDIDPKRFLAGADFYLPPGYDETVAGVSPSATFNNVYRVIGGRHFAGENYLFVDGHVKWLDQASVVGGSTPSDTRFSVAQ